MAMMMMVMQQCWCYCIQFVFISFFFKKITSAQYSVKRTKLVVVEYCNHSC